MGDSPSPGALAGPLEGFVVGVTADRRAEEQSEMLLRRGARVLHGPTIRTLPLGPDDGLRAATELLVARPPDILIANTGIGVRGWFAAAESWGLGDALAQTLAEARIYARGPKAAGAILTAGLPVVWRAPSETLAEVVEHLATEGSLSGVRVALQLDGKVEQLEVARLRDHGAEVIEIPVYLWTLPLDAQPALRLIDAVCDERLDAITFTSAAAVHNLFEIADRHGRQDALRNALNTSVVPMCVGPVCAGAATQYGVAGIAPARPRLGAMIHALTDQLTKRQYHLHIGSTDVMIQGSLVVIDGAPVHLSDRERAVFHVLLRKNGAVVSRPELLRMVWGSTDADAHALEMTVTRLRQRLGSVGRIVETVVRRGYRISGSPISGGVGPLG